MHTDPAHIVLRMSISVKMSNSEHVGIAVEQTDIKEDPQSSDALAALQFKRLDLTDSNELSDVGEQENNGITSRKDGRTHTSLCAKCWYVFDHLFEVDSPSAAERLAALSRAFPFYSNTSFIEKSAKAGCYLCHQLFAALGVNEVDGRSEIERGGIITVSGSRDDKGDIEPLWLFTIVADRDGYDIDIMSYFEAKDNAILTSEEFGTNLKDSIQLTRAWIEGCENHEDCRPPGIPYLPTRLVHVGNSITAPRLVLSSTLNRDTKYLTLSHCWGKAPICTLRLENIAAFMTEIPLGILSNTFQDAIVVTRGLGVDYIWIDSLCIIQDKDCDDWSKEAGKMASVYSSSFLNIAATNAENGNGGLFYRGPPQPETIFRVDAVAKGGKVTGTCFPTSMWKIWSQSLPLLRRGWVFQEMILAPRTVHFTWNQIFWECNTINFCSAWPDGKTPWEWGRFVHLLGLLKKPVSAYDWRSIVQEYSKYSLTYGTDRLIALSGIARALQQTQHQEYCVGLWKENLIDQLCWHRSTGFTEHIRPNAEDWKDEYMGPSWSWISLAYPVDLHYKKFDRAHARVLGINAEYATSDIFGAVTSAELYLTCDYVCSIKIPVPLEPTDTAGMTLWPTANCHIWDVDVQLKLNFDYRGKGDLCYLVALLSKPTGEVKPNLLSGLILQSTGIKSGEYHRIGIFTASETGGNEDISTAYLNWIAMSSPTFRDLIPVLTSTASVSFALSEYWTFMPFLRPDISPQSLVNFWDSFLYPSSPAWLGFGLTSSLFGYLSYRSSQNPSRRLYGWGVIFALSHYAFGYVEVSHILSKIPLAPLDDVKNLQRKWLMIHTARTIWTSVVQVDVAWRLILPGGQGETKGLGSEFWIENIFAKRSYSWPVLLFYPALLSPEASSYLLFYKRGKFHTYQIP
ncbi:hypothetical protein VTL71DRAFT_9571 [Oculimacula yallundae]|uniref:Heterokaryon incompatibility domain-containing protein n=1 Tax=Oculimacula yallundae TaxID=86028 RepID=A0ABR4BR72_9HELO